MRAVVGKLPTAYVRAIFEDHSFTCLRNIEEVPKFRNWVTLLVARTVKGQFVWFVFVCVPNLKVIASSVTTILHILIVSIN